MQTKRDIIDMIRCKGWSETCRLQCPEGQASQRCLSRPHIWQSAGKDDRVAHAEADLLTPLSGAGDGRQLGLARRPAGDGHVQPGHRVRSLAHRLQVEPPDVGVLLSSRSISARTRSHDSPALQLAAVTLRPPLCSYHTRALACHCTDSTALLGRTRRLGDERRASIR